MIGAIILAAGSSRRFGDDKRQARLPNGRMVIQQSIENTLDCFDQVLVVLRHDDVQFEQKLQNLFADRRIRTFRAPESALGMGHSLANAISQVAGWQGAFVFLADMPHLREETLRLLKSQMQANDIVVPTYNDRFGHPVGFDQAYFDEIAGIKGDKGAKPVIQAHRDKVVEVPVADVGVLQDVDTPGDITSERK